MIKTQQLNKLFIEWENDKPSYRNSFSRDGIINEELWNKVEAKRQILFLFKERNQDGGEPDFRKLLDKDPNPWPVVGYWSYGLQNIVDNYLPNFEEAKKNSKDACKSSAIVNLKKTPGRGSSNMEEIQHIASSDKERIEEELRIISPEIIVCGGTFGICEQLWNMDEKMSERVYKTAIFKNIAWIDFVHPAARVNQDILYYALLYFFGKYLKSKNEEVEL